MTDLPDLVRVLEFEGPFRGTRVTVHPVLLADPASPLLVDTGLPGQADTLRRLLAQEGVELAQLRWLVLTHQDLRACPGKTPPPEGDRGPQKPRSDFWGGLGACLGNGFDKG